MFIKAQQDYAKLKIANSRSQTDYHSAVALFNEMFPGGDGWLKTRHRTRHMSQALDQAMRTGGAQLGSDGRLGCHCTICFAKIARQQQLWRAYAHL